MTLRNLTFRQHPPFERPVCSKCGGDTLLTRISPVPKSEPMRVERRYRCDLCQVEITVEDPSS
jgi:hypothetical protein